MPRKQKKPTTSVTVVKTTPLAIIVNLIVAAVVGTLLPGYLKSLQIDPALAGGVVLTTVTDVVGFFCFLGIATLVYA